MSRHRFIRNINVDDELDDDAISDGGEDFLTDEQHSQMISGLNHVRDVLGSEEESGFDDKTIQDSLWDCYFDVERCIEWLIEEQRKRQAARDRKDTSGKPLPPLPPDDEELASPTFQNMSEEDQEYYEATEMYGYPDTYRPALSTITEMTERSEYSRNWVSARKHGVPGYAESLSTMTEYPGQYDSVGIPPSPTQSALQRLSFYEAAPSPVTRTSSATPTPRPSAEPVPSDDDVLLGFATRPIQPPAPSTTAEIPAQLRNPSANPKKSKLSSLASSRTITRSFDSSTSSKSSRSFSVDSESILTYPALRPSAGSRMSLSSEVTVTSEGATSTSSHIRRAIQAAMEMEIADQAIKPSEVTSEPSDASTPRQHTPKPEMFSTPSSPPLVSKLDSQGRVPSKLAQLAQAKAQQNSDSWVPKPKTKSLRSQLPETQVHNTRTKYIIPVANGPTATTAITTSYQSLGNLMPPWSTQSPPAPPLSELGPVTTSPQRQMGSSKQLPAGSSESKSPKQSKLAMKVKQSKQQKLIPEAEFIEDLASVQPLFVPSPAQVKAAPSAFASVLIDEVDPGKIVSRGYNDGSRKSKPHSHKDRLLLPTGSPSHDPAFAFDVPSPDDLIYNARKGSSLGHSDARSKSANSRSTNISSTSKPAKEREKVQKAAQKRLAQVSSSSKSGSPVSTPKRQTNRTGVGSPKYSETSTPTRGEIDQRLLDLSAMNLKTEDNLETADEEQKVPQATYAREKLLEEVAKKLQAVAKGEKKGISLVAVGHVDAGKSTLMGRMLYEMGKVDEKERLANERASGNIGKRSFSWAWQLDDNLEERERGVTMDIAMNSFVTPHRQFTILDAPGHRDFIPNMISGASQADCAILVVDSAIGEFEAGFERGGQTREHLLLVRSLGVSQIIVAVNKLDLVNWEKSRYDDICNHLRPFLVQSGFHPSKSAFVPVAAMLGVNLVNCDGSEARGLREWYDGPSLADLLDRLEPPTRDITSPLRFPIFNVFKGSGSGAGVTGRVCSGVVQTGERLRILPGDETGVVKSISIDGDSLPWAAAGQNVTMYLTAVDPIHLDVGTVLCPLNDVIPLATVFTARIIVFEIGVPITAGTSVELYHHSRDVPAYISKLHATLDKGSGKVLKFGPRVLTKGSSAEVQISLRSLSSSSAKAQPMPLEIFSVNKEMGRVLIRRGGETIAAGVVLAIGE